VLNASPRSDADAEPRPAPLIRVARDVEAELANTKYAGDPRWEEAALLHDVGKLDSGLGVFGRVLATLAGAAAGHDMAEPWSQKRGITRKFGLYLRHPELGASRIRMCDGSREAALWAEAHQDPTAGEHRLPDVVIQVLGHRRRRLIYRVSRKQAFGVRKGVAEGPKVTPKPVCDAWGGGEQAPPPLRA
jgi:hypothetical protein